MNNMLNEFKQKLKTGMEDAKRQQATVAANPALASSPEVKRSMRATGAIMLVLGAGLTIANYLTWRSTGNFLIIAVAGNIVFPIAGLFMLISGKNPFKRFKK